MHKMIFSADPDVQAVAEFMQQNVQAARLVGVAAGVSVLAPLLWGHYGTQVVQAVSLSAGDLHIPLGASE